MRITKAKKRLEQVPITKPKRVDLNEAQLYLQRSISDLPEENLEFLQREVGRILEGSLEPHPVGEFRFYRSPEVSKVLGISPQTIERYIYGYLRIVRREEETSAEFHARKTQVLKTAEAYRTPQEHWMLSARILIFLVMAQTQVRGFNPTLKLLRKSLAESSRLDVCRPLPIHKNSGVTTWVV